VQGTKERAVLTRAKGWLLPPPSLLCCIVSSGKIFFLNKQQVFIDAHRSSGDTRQRQQPV
jgi:hypothetical protein